MVLFTIAWFGVKESLRDYSGLIQMLVMPIVLIFILGTALGGAFQPQDISATRVAVLNDSIDQMGGQAFEQFLNEPNVQSYLSISSVQTLDEGMALLENGEVWGFAHLENGFARLNLYTNTENQFRAGILENMLQTFVMGANVALTQLSLGSAHQAFQYQEGLVNEEGISPGHLPRAIDYYGVTMLVMILFYGSSYGSYGMAQDYLESLGKRLKSMPIRTWELFVGKTLGFVGVVFMQGLIVVFFTHWVYGANWGDNLLSIALITLLFSIFSVGFGIMVCMVTRDKQLASKVLAVLIPVLTFVAGGYFRIDRPGAVLGFLQRISPSYLAQTAFFNTIYSGSVAETWSSITGLAMLTILSFVVASVAGRRAFQ